MRILTKEVKIHGSHGEMKKGLCDTWVAINGWKFSLVGKSQRHSRTKDMLVLSERKAFISKSILMKYSEFLSFDS